MTDQSPSQAAALTPEVREDLKAKALKASNGPWTREGDGARALLRDAGLMILAVRHRIPAALHEANFDFIAAANPSTILAYEAALEEAEAREHRVCAGCGTSRSMADLKAGGHVSCCPERKMLTAAEWAARAEKAEQGPSAQQQENERLREALRLSEAKSDMLADSNYLAGVSAGWNAAQDGNPNEALAKIQNSRKGHIGAYRAALQAQDQGGAS